MGRRKQAIDYLRAIQLMDQGGLTRNTQHTDMDEVTSLKERVDRLLGIINKTDRPSSNMLFFIMYDIESNKVRYNIAKYLQAKGCTRVQHSIFLADLPTNDYNAIKNDLAAVQAMYDNHDSIIVCPVSTEMLNGMQVIGLDINIDIITHKKNTLFF